jgi:hypothetical protein
MTAHLKDMAGGAPPPQDANLMGHLYWSAIHGPIMLHFSGKLAYGISAVTLIEKLVEILNAHFFPAGPANEA